MAKDIVEKAVEEKACDCECHKGAMCEGGKCAAGDMSGMSMKPGCEHGCCAHHCMRRVWKAVLVCVAVLAIFWIGICVGEFRSSWGLERSFGPGMMYNYNTGGTNYYPNMMYRGAYQQDVTQGAATLTREATSSEATSTPAKAVETPKKK